MKFLKFVFVALVLLVNLAIAQPAFADSPKFTKSADYKEVTQTIDTLLKARENPDQTDYTAEEIQQQLADLQLQKYILGTATDWAQCRNETGKTLAVYASRAKKAIAPGTLYYLGAGKVTDDDWNCDGVYLPSGTQAALTPNAPAQALTEPLALKIVNGTQLIATTNPDTGAIEFNLPPAKLFRDGEINWSIPTLSQADIDAQKLSLIHI